MTTFSLVDTEVQVGFNATTATTNNQALYTVPAGKIARVDFDSCHWRSTGFFGRAAFMVWSKPANVLRKHYVGNYQRQQSVRSLSFYPAWSSFANVEVSNASGGVYFSGAESSAQIQNSINSDGSVNPEDSLVESTPVYNSATNGTRFFGPKSIYLNPGEQMLFFTKYADNDGQSVNVWVNFRLAVWLEDV
jgi:hypothetical protein